MKYRFRVLAVTMLLVVPGSSALGQASSTSSETELAKAAQNPVADLISLPLQNNATFGVGENDRTRNVLNIQPVIPVKAGDWVLINRTILPVVTQPDVFGTSGSTFGLGDLNHSLFVSPAKPGKVIWGLGPIILLPTATDRVLGSGKWGLGPSIVVLSMPGPWVIGVLANNLWSVAGDGDRDDVNVFLLQPIVNYNLAGGWYLASAPIITANWEADRNNRWTVPLGGGFGRVFRIGKQAMNVNTQLFYNVESPQIAGGDLEWRLQVQALFPK